MAPKCTIANWVDSNHDLDDHAEGIDHVFLHSAATLAAGHILGRVCMARMYWKTNRLATGQI